MQCLGVCSAVAVCRWCSTIKGIPYVRLQISRQKACSSSTCHMGDGVRASRPHHRTCSSCKDWGSCLLLHMAACCLQIKYVKGYDIADREVAEACRRYGELLSKGTTHRAANAAAQQLVWQGITSTAAAAAIMAAGFYFTAAPTAGSS